MVYIWWVAIFECKKNVKCTQNCEKNQNVHKLRQNVQKSIFFEKCKKNQKNTIKSKAVYKKHRLSSDRGSRYFALFCVIGTCSGTSRRYFALFCVILEFTKIPLEWGNFRQGRYYMWSQTRSCGMLTSNMWWPGRRMSAERPTAAKSRASPATSEVGGWKK